MKVFLLFVLNGFKMSAIVKKHTYLPETSQENIVRKFPCVECGFSDQM